MPSVQIKDVPEDTHRVLRELAAPAHQSLQEYLRSKLVADASQPTLEEVLVHHPRHGLNLTRQLSRGGIVGAQQLLGSHQRLFGVTVESVQFAAVVSLIVRDDVVPA